jgi:hypothetical protein
MQNKQEPFSNILFLNIIFHPYIFSTIFYLHLNSGELEWLTLTTVVST